ncbi:MAG: CheR family methyltransferase [Candidatus Omnitrophota bacterium]
MFFSEELNLKLKNFITNRSGLYFRDHEIKNLQDVIAKRMAVRGLDSVFTYYTYLTSSPEREEEFRQLLNALTVNHTYFFRNESQFKALREKVLPEIIQRKLTQFGNRPPVFESTDNSQNVTTDLLARKPTLRIWSAGCSSGEEPYSIAMVVRDIIPDIENWDIHILATDAATESLDRAQKGVFNANAVKLVPKQCLERYFDLDTSGHSKSYAVKNDIKEMVHFVFHNLIEDEFPQGFDIIFCRNVVIYFEFETIVNTMYKFHSSLFDGGYLFIGYSENLHFMRDKFTMVSWDEAIYYRKETASVSPVTLTIEHPAEKVDLEEIIEELSRCEAKVELGIISGKQITPGNAEELITDIIKYTHLKKYTQALALAEEAIRLYQNTLEPYYLAAEIYINQGNFTAAKGMLMSALRLNPLFAAAHYLFGCVYIEEEEPDKAKESFRKALYLDKDFSLAHFYLANLYRTEDSLQEAIREYRNTLKGLSKYSLDAIIAYSGGFSVATLANICRDNIERLKME